MMNDDTIKLYNDALSASEEMREKLSKLRIKVNGSQSSKVITAIREVFGDAYITDKGDAYITYDMYCAVINLIRDLGNHIAQETV